MLNQTIAFIGGGNMARSLVGGLIARGVSAQQLIVADPVTTQLETLAQQYGVHTTTDNLQAVRNAQVVLLAVKPQELRAVCETLAPALQDSRPLVISIAAGICAGDIQRWLEGLDVVRTMPNRPAMNGYGMTALYADAQLPAASRQLAEDILGAVGATLWVEQENMMDAVTAISGSGPAYFFLLIELLEQAGVALGLPTATSRTLAVETAHGAGFMAHALPESPATLREQVTSKGGTTEAALKVFAAHRLGDIVQAATRAAADRSAELAAILGRGEPAK